MSSSVVSLQGVILFTPRTFSDYRGYFRETYTQKVFDTQVGKKNEFVQDNESLSLEACTIRGLHFQRHPHAQAKLVRVASGAIFDVAVDIRRDSPTYGRWVGYELSAENGHQLFVPVGFAHGFCTLVDNTVVCYKVTDYYSPECDGGILWNDPAIGVEWPLSGRKPVLSDKDAALPLLSDLGMVF